MAFAPRLCPNPNCPHHLSRGGTFIKKGHFRIQRINQRVRRFQCKACQRYFSSRSFKADYRHKKMDLNQPLAKLLVEGCSIRAAGRILGMTYRSTYRKFQWLTRQAQQKNQSLKLRATELQFDEMETIHHTKCKPLSIAVLVNENYQVLAAQVAEMPAKGPLAAFSFNKYGPRMDLREQAMQEAFEKASRSLILPPQKCLSDAKPGYRKYVAQFFPGAGHEVHSRVNKERHRDRLHEVAQKKKYDPLFALNQRCALLRSHIKRLTRRSWCTTKKPENLQGHLDLFIAMQFDWNI